MTRRGPSLLGRGDLATSLLLIFPLFLAYEIGILFTPAANGVDFVSQWVFVAVGRDPQLYAAAYGILALAFVAFLLYLRKRRAFSLDMVWPMLFESAIYALTLGSVIVFVLGDVLGIPLSMGGQGPLAGLELGDTGRAFVVSLGAGVHEELVFRLALFSGGAALLCWAGVDRGVALALALVASSLLFSAAHHIGPLGDPWALGVFLYRFLAGVLFALIYYFRSLAHAVYTHFLYDLYVLVLAS